MLDKKLHDNKLKIATAIGKIKSTGVNVTPPDINESLFTFSPDIEHNAIRYGLSGITRIGEDLIQTIMANRPYVSLDDFVEKVRLTKPQMVNLIKSGAFDGFGDRIELMHDYVDKISDKKKRMTLQQVGILIEHKLLPSEFEFEIKVFNFTKYLKKFKEGDNYRLDDIAFSFYEKNFSVDDLFYIDNKCYISQAKWKKYYDAYMAKIKVYINAHSKELLDKLNAELVQEVWNKYCQGTISKWEMDSVSYYSHEHELVDVDNEVYGFADFFALPDEPVVDRILNFQGKRIPMFKLYRIAGTVLDRDKSKKTVSLLTTNGVVTVKIYGVFAQYDKQISERGADGKKHVLRKSEFTRGNKIVVCGMKQDNMFIAKKYKNTPYHFVETIGSIDNGMITMDNRNDEVA